MKIPQTRDIPPRAAVAVIALVLLASVVTGREDEPAPAAPADVRPPASAAPVPETAHEPSAADLDLDKLKRPRKDGKIGDLFAPRVVAPPRVVVQPVVVKADPVAPPAPTAPPLPFKYLGMYVNGGRLVVFLSKNDEPYSAAQGETIDNDYRIDEITDTAVTFNYLPLGMQQTLPIPPQARE